MDSFNINSKNPFKFTQVKKISQALKKYNGKFVILKIPVVSEVVYGRKVGYKIKKINLPKKLKKFQQTNIRKKIFNE